LLSEGKETVQAELPAWGSAALPGDPGRRFEGEFQDGEKKGKLSAIIERLRRTGENADHGVGAEETSCK